MTQIRWPDGLRPEQAHVFAHNEIETDLPPERIWPWLLCATRWHELYSNCKRLRIMNGEELALGTRFTFWTFGAKVTTVIEEFEPNVTLAWSGTGLGARGYHAWVFERTSAGCRFITEETQRGAVVAVVAPLMRRGLLHFHQRWLEGLVRAARQGAPGEVKTN